MCSSDLTRCRTMSLLPMVPFLSLPRKKWTSRLEKKIRTEVVDEEEPEPERDEDDDGRSIRHVSVSQKDRSNDYELGKMSARSVRKGHGVGSQLASISRFVMSSDSSRLMLQTNEINHLLT